MAMSSWMESVTGRSNSEHQAWRDNLNGGWAAGDWTGNHNQQIASDRADAGERNPDVLANLPADYRLRPVGAGKTASGSVGQGASPSQSGGRNPVVMDDPQVRRSGSTLGVGQITGSRVNFGASSADANFGQTFASALAAFSKPGPNKHAWDDPALHGQLYINGHKVVHDTGWSPAEEAENIYGDDFSPATLYGWGKAWADLDATLAANGQVTTKQAYESTDFITGPFGQAGRDIRGWLDNTYSAADKAWNQMVQDVNKAVPPSYPSTPGPANPYAGSSPWSMPFN